MQFCWSDKRLNSRQYSDKANLINIFLNSKFIFDYIIKISRDDPS